MFRLHVCMCELKRFTHMYVCRNTCLVCRKSLLVHLCVRTNMRLCTLRMAHACNTDTHRIPVSQYLVSVYHVSISSVCIMCACEKRLCCACMRGAENENMASVIYFSGKVGNSVGEGPESFKFLCTGTAIIPAPCSWASVCPRLHYRLLTLCPAAY